MSTFVIATGPALLIARRASTWVVEQHLREMSAECVAVDAHNPARLYCGTWGQGLWRSDDRYAYRGNAPAGTRSGLLGGR